MHHEAAIDEGFLAVLGARGGGAELGDESAAPAETGAGEVEARREVKKVKTQGWVVERRLWKRKQIKPVKAHMPGRLQFMAGRETTSCLLSLDW